MKSGSSQRIAGPIALAFGLALVVSLVILRDGIEISPDGWAYWQGSVRLLDDGQYRYFIDDLPIRNWPPGYSLYLAGWQSVLGVSGATLVYANAILIAFTAGCWTWLCLKILSPLLQESSVWYGRSIAIYLAAFFSVALRSVLATNLLYVVLPLFLLLTFSASRQDRHGHLLGMAAGCGLLAAIMLLTHNSALALVPMGGFLLLVNRNVAPRQRWLAACLLGILAVAPWYVVRTLLEQNQSHQIGFGAAKYSPLAYAWQLFHGIAYLLASKPGMIVLVGMIPWLAHIFRRIHRAESGEIRELGKRMAAAVGIPVVMLFLMFNLIFIEDQLSGRFLLFVPALLVPFAIAGHGWSATSERTTDRGVTQRLLRLGHLCLIVVMAVTTQRTIKRAWMTPFRERSSAERELTISEDFVHRRHAIAPDFVEQRPQQFNGRVLVSPPVYDWLRDDASKRTAAIKRGEHR